MSYIFVSPNMHKVHHHWKQPYTDSNYGAVLSIWDRMLGTFKTLAPSSIRYGLDRYYPNEKDEDFLHLMKSPFEKMEEKNRAGFAVIKICPKDIFPSEPLNLHLPSSLLNLSIKILIFFFEVHFFSCRRLYHIFVYTNHIHFRGNPRCI